MRRRDFLKLASIAGLGVAGGGLSLLGRAHADAPYDGPFWIMVHADGGWDPTSLCDPKGSADPSSSERINTYAEGEIETAGNIRYAPLGSNRGFFENHYQDLLVVNGIDCATNSHDAGVRVTWSGSLRENSPAFAALVAGVKGPERPMAFLSNGGYETTSGAVAVTRIGATEPLSKIAYPNVPGAGSPRFHSDETIQRIRNAHAARDEAARTAQHLPYLVATRNQLDVARAGQDDLARVMTFLPSAMEASVMKRQAQVAVAAFRAGVSISANLSLAGFDTHGNHDLVHTQKMTELLDGVSFLLAQLDQYLPGKAVVVLGSDFGRTPAYNRSDGKDHWSITSMMMVGKGIFSGNRVVGATDAGLLPRNVDPGTLEVSDAGVRITPTHVHQALRKLAGIDATALAGDFPLASVDELPLFG